MMRSYSSFDWFEFDGQCSDEFNTIIKNLTILSRPARNVQRALIPGRDGDLTISDDTYSTVPAVISCLWENNVNLDDLNVWLSGKGDLILSYQPDRKYKAEISNTIEFISNGAYLQADISMIVQPFSCETVPNVIELTTSQTVYCPGTRWSLPKLTVYGSGTLTIGDYTLVVTATDGESYVVIDSEIGECYYGSANRGSKVAGDFPRLDTGEIDITLGAGITKVELQGNWRWY
jgi:phage-related protein